MTTYRVTLRTLTPLHIGDGTELRLGFDFMVHNNQTYRLNEDAILLAKMERLTPDRSGVYPMPGELLSPQDYEQSRFFRYVLRGAPRSRKADARILSFIKDIHDRPYIPGSSLKGALRTALAWTGWEEVRPPLDSSALIRSRSWAGQPLERRLFGPDPNHNLLRALQISDLFGPQKPGESLLVVNAQVLTKRSQGSPIELEALPGDVVFHGSLKIDDSLFTPQAERELSFGNRRHWLDELLARARAHSQARIQKLSDWFEQAEMAQRAAEFYRQLSAAKLAPNQALLQIGWGAGWDGKTFGSRLQANSQFFEKIVSDYRLHRAPRGSPPRRPGEPFPRSRRAAVIVRAGQAQAVAPFGWVLVELAQL